MQIEPIGFVRSPVAQGVDERWGDVIADIELRPELAPGLHGLNQFSHVVVVFYMHQASFDAADLQRRPQGRADMPLLGIFAQRAKHRPNPLGITTVQLVQVAGHVLQVKGLDAIDGTPVLDIKPYFPAFDRVADAAVPPWVPLLMQNYF